MIGVPKANRGPMAQQRTAILIRCTEEEADLIRDAARKERRTVSGFILNAVQNRIQTRMRIEAELGRNQKAPGKPRS
jgi:uncharacterized protein (DUF1778 family)